VRNGGNSRSASRRNRRSLFAQPPVPVEGGPAAAPTPGVTKEASAPDGE
jgi:hypothetical protein